MPTSTPRAQDNADSWQNNGMNWSTSVLTRLNSSLYVTSFSLAPDSDAALTADVAPRSSDGLLISVKYASNNAFRSAP
jgi:hypothetical protein